MSWKPDPGAKYVNTFSRVGKNVISMLSPFSVIAACLQKMEQDQASGVRVVPVWPTQPWFTPLLHVSVDSPALLPQSDLLLTQPHNHALHPLRKQLRLMACKLSGKASSREIFQTRLQRSSSSPDLMEHKSSTNCTSNSGLTFVVNGRLILTTHLWRQF